MMFEIASGSSTIPTANQAQTQIHLKDPTLLMDRNYISGEWRNSSSGNVFKVLNPATNEAIATCAESTIKDLKEAAKSAATALTKWRAKSGRERSRFLRRLYDLMMQNRDDLAAIISHENGKAQADAAGEVGLAASFVEWFVEEAARIHGDVVPHSSTAFRVSVLKEPIGVCGLITPWNFPVAMITRKLAACLAAGCTAVIKPDGQTPLSAGALAVLAQRAEFPAGTINIVHALDNTPSIGLAMCESPLIRKISFTGSTRVGKILLQQSAPNIQKLSLELGGNAPFIVFEDADLDIAVTSLLASKFKVSGQTCVCANRIFVNETVHDAFVERVVAAVQKFKIGPASDPTSTIGPLINSTAVAKSRSHVEDAIAKGATVLTGYGKTAVPGPNFFPPTVLINATRDMLVAREETFGPVAAIFRFTSEKEVMEAANDCDVGLAAYLITRDSERAHRVSETLQMGMVAVNTGVISDAAAPFGGMKHSGFGREGSKYGIDEYLQLKTVVTGNIRAHL